MSSYAVGEARVLTGLETESPKSRILAALHPGTFVHKLITRGAREA